MRLANHSRLWRVQYLALCLLSAFGFASLAFGQAGEVASESAIQVADNQINDARIESRIEGILDKIDGLQEVSVAVDAGVVTLAGEASNDRLASAAIDIASRTVGIVTVNDDINRTLDIADNVRPIVNEFQDRLKSFARALPLVLVALGFVALFTLLAGLVARWQGLWRRVSPNPFLAEILSQAVRIVIIAMGVVLALTLIGASKFIATLLGGAGVIGIAISFAVRDTLENYISSIMLSLRQPFRAQDHVVINEHEGFVVRLTSRATILMTLDGNHLRIPNAVVFKGVILNYTTNPERRLDFQLGVDGDDDPLLAMQVGLEAINQQDFILHEPSAGAMIDFVGDSSIVIKFTAWVNQTDTDFSKARSVAIKVAKAALELNGFTLPEPIYRLRFDASSSIDRAVLAEFETNQSERGIHKEDTPCVATPAETSIAKSPTSESAATDVSVDRQLQQKVSEERAREAEYDLLDQKSPTE